MANSLELSPVQIGSRLGIGAFGLRLDEDGGVVSDAQIEVGYGRRKIEEIFKGAPISLCLSYAERIDHLAAPAYNLALATCFESLLGIETPGRGQQIRKILLELNRINSHLHFFAKISKASGQGALTNYCLRERERFADVMEMFCGSRMGFGAIVLGGVVDDATDGWFFRIEKGIAALREFIPDLLSSLLQHPFFQDRAKGLAIISLDEALRFKLSGPNARASGLRARTAMGAGFSEGKISEGRAFLQTDGDTFSRAWARLAEIEGSAELILDYFRQMPSGNFRIKVGHNVVASQGLAFAEVNGPRGLLSVAVESGGGSAPNNVHVFTPSSMVVRALPGLLRGLQVEDVFLVIQSLDISFSEVDK